MLTRKLRSAVRLYRSGGLSTLAESAWDQSRGYIEVNAIVLRRGAYVATLLTRLFNDRPDYPYVRFSEADVRACRGVLLIPYLRRQFFDVIRLADLSSVSDAELLIVADSLYRRWHFAVLDQHLGAWRERFGGTPAGPALDMMARRVALRLGRLSEAGAGLPASGGDLATCLLRAEVLDARGELTSATRAFEEALHRQSHDGVVRLLFGFHLLKTGRTLEGFENWGMADGLLGSYPLRRRARRWTGEDLDGRALLVVFEHGLGDMIQMSRFLHPLAEAHPGARLIGRVPRPLVSLLARSFPLVRFVASEDPDPPYDVYIPSMQLPLVIEAETLLPNRDYLSLDAVTQGPRRGTRSRVGICWRGHPRQYEATRSIPLATFARLFGRDDVDFIVLLNTLTPEEDSVLDGFSHVFRPPIHDFVELGALCASCDLVVSVDTAVTHVAGAGGVPALLLSRPDACWRWGPAGSRTPWYDTVHVLRHPGDMDWAHVLDEAQRQIDERVARADTCVA